MHNCRIAFVFARNDTVIAATWKMRRNNGEAFAGSSSSVSLSHAATGVSALPSSSYPQAASVDESAQQEAEISALLKVSNGLVQWSPCGALFAAAHSNRLTIREKSTLQIVQQYSAVDVIQSVAWSDDSQLVSTAMYKRALVQVRNPLAFVVYPSHVMLVC